MVSELPRSTDGSEKQELKGAAEFDNEIGVWSPGHPDRLSLLPLVIDKVLGISFEKLPGIRSGKFVSFIPTLILSSDVDGSLRSNVHADQKKTFSKILCAAIVAYCFVDSKAKTSLEGH